MRAESSDMQKQRPHLRSAAAISAFGAVAAATAYHFHSKGGAPAVAALCAIGAGAAAAAFFAPQRHLRVVAIMLLALALPATADAHAFLKSSTPASGTSLSRAPHIITLQFTESVSPTLTHIQIFDASGSERDPTAIRQGARSGELRVTLPKLAKGAYRIAYSTVSQVDLHATSGAIVFGAGTAAPAQTTSVSATPGTNITESVAHLFDLLSLSVLIAICALLAGNLPPVVRARISRFALVALPTLLLAGIVALAGKSSQFPLHKVLVSTSWGHAMLVREAAIVAVLVAVALGRRRLALALLVPVAAAEAVSGHAGSLDAAAAVAMVAHILAGGLWVGGLVVLALVLPGLERRDVLDTLGRFGRLAAASVAVVVITGLYSAGRQVESVDALLSSTYGWSLVVKIGLLGATGTFGVLGFLAVRRRRPSMPWLAAEAAAAVGVLLAASLLLSTPPARGPQFAPAPRQITGSTIATGQARDLLVDVAASPNRPGQNFVTATILDTLRPSPGPIRSVTMTFFHDGRRVTVPATRLDASKWQVAGTQLSAPGVWHIAVAAERKGQGRATFSTPWTVSTLPLPPGIHSPRYSQRPLEPILTALAIALALLLATAGLWLARGRLGIRRPRTA
jgi:copper transport protein